MKFEDLGEINGDIVLFGGIYSNVHALRSLLDWLASSGIATSNCICTGDIVAYCASPAEASALMVERGIKSIAGNCERQLASGAEDCGCGFEEGSDCDRASKGWFPYAQTKTADFKSYYAGLPDIATFRAFGKRYAVIHGGVTDISRFLWPVSDEAEFSDEIAALEAVVGEVDGVVCGHSGIAFERYIGGKQWINAGVIGMPPHDGRPETRFAVLSEDGIRFHRLAYPHTEAAQAMMAAGLRHGYELSLTSGIWPSEDILPDALRR